MYHAFSYSPTVRVVQRTSDQRRYDHKMAKRIPTLFPLYFTQSIKFLITFECWTTIAKKLICRALFRQFLVWPSHYTSGLYWLHFHMWKACMMDECFRGQHWPLVRPLKVSIAEHKLTIHHTKLRNRRRLEVQFPFHFFVWKVLITTSYCYKAVDCRRSLSYWNLHY